MPSVRAPPLGAEGAERDLTDPHLSLGFDGASISGMKYSLPKWVSGITRQLYCEDKDAYFESLMSHDVKEFEP
jgi:hypothetical protein